MRSVHKISDIAEVVMGQSPPGTSYNSTGRGIPLVNGPTEFTARYPVKLQWTTEPTKKCKKGDILYCVRGSSTGRYNVADDVYCIGRGVAAIRAKENKASPAFIEQLLIYLTSSLLKKATGSTFPNLSKEAIESFEAKVPSFERQHKIGKMLATWDRAIDLNKRAKHLISIRRRAYLDEIFLDLESRKDCTTSPVSDFSKLFAGGTPPTKNIEYWKDGTIPWMSSGEVNYREIFQTEKCITEKGLKNSAAKYVPVNSILIALAGQGTTRGKVAINRFKLTTNQSLAAVIPDPKVVLPDYLFHYLDSKYDYLRLISDAGGGRGGLNLKLIGDFKVTYPNNLLLQERIAKFLWTLEHQVIKHAALAESLKVQKFGIMQRIFGDEK